VIRKDGIRTCVIRTDEMKRDEKDKKENVRSGLRG
jgi:hypothetical protein